MLVKVLQYVRLSSHRILVGVVRARFMTFSWRKWKVVFWPWDSLLFDDCFIFTFFSFFLSCHFIGTIFIIHSILFFIFFRLDHLHLDGCARVSKRSIAQSSVEAKKLNVFVALILITNCRFHFKNHLNLQSKWAQFSFSPQISIHFKRSDIQSSILTELFDFFYTVNGTTECMGFALLVMSTMKFFLLFSL